MSSAGHAGPARMPSSPTDRCCCSFRGLTGTALIVAVATGGPTAYLAKRGLDELGVPTDAAAERVKEAAQQAVSSP